MRRSAVVLLLLVACESGAEVEDGVFFPTWSADGAVPGGIVQGVCSSRRTDASTSARMVNELSRCGKKDSDSLTAHFLGPMVNREPRSATSYMVGAAGTEARTVEPMSKILRVSGFQIAVSWTKARIASR
jgi:hypothetical protein